MNIAARPLADGERRARLEAALRERAALLRPPAALLERALQRCPPRTGTHEPALVPSAAPGIGSSALVPNQPGAPLDLVPVAPITVVPAEVPGDPTPAPVTLLMADAVPAPALAATGSVRLQAEIPTVITAVIDMSAPSSVPAGAAAGHAASAPTLISHHEAPAHPITGGSSSGANAVILTIGRIIAGYRIESQIGSGGMGQVYRATQLSMNRPVAFKVLAPKLAGNPRFRERFLREARAAGRLHHPNLIAVHDVGEADGLMFFSMELVQGQSLKDLLAARGTVPETRALELTRQTLEALRYAHGNGLIHRDIKPDNLMLTAAGVVKVADLGLSRSADAEVAGDELFKTQAGAIMGTPHYMAPEQARDAHSVDHRADLYSVGATLYHLVCGTTPFTGNAPMEVVIRAGTQPLSFPEPGPTPSMQVLIARLMAKNPDERFATAAEAIEAVVRLRRRTSEISEDRAVEVATAIARARGRRLRRVLRKGGWIAGGLAALLLVLFGLAALFGSWQWSDKRAEVRRFCEQHHYAEARLSLDLFSQGMNPLAASAAVVAEARLAVDREWDEWAVAEAKPVFDAFHEQVGLERWNDAFAILSDIEDDWKSPQVRRDLDAAREQVKQGLHKAGGAAAPRGDGSPHAPAPAPGGATAPAAAPAKPVEALNQRLREFKEQQTRLLSEFWEGFDAVPAGSLTANGEVARCTGSGTASQRAVAKEERPLLHRGMWVTVRFDGVKAGGPETLGIALGAGRTLQATQHGLVVSSTGAEQLLQAPPPFSTQLTFMLRRSGSDLEIKTASASDWQTLHASTADKLTLSWRAGTGAIEVKLKPLLRRD